MTQPPPRQSAAERVAETAFTVAFVGFVLVVMLPAAMVYGAGQAAAAALRSRSTSK
jgi:hypothetical protein